MGDSDDDYSDLTEIDELDETVPASQKSQKAAKRAARGDFRISGALKMPRVASYSAWSVYQQLTGGDIDLDADYQRGVVWPDTKQSGLIDSVFKNFFIPPVIFVVKMDQDGAEKRTCVDGKQRLTSIWRFIDGEIPYRDPDTGKKWWYKQTPEQKGGNLIPEHFRKVFNSKQVVAIEYEDLNDNTEREIFQRVQMGMALTPAEKLKSINTATSKFITELCSLYVYNGLEDSLNWDTARSSDFRCVASAVYSILNPVGKSKTGATVPALEKWLKKPDKVDDDFAASTRQTFAIFLALSRDSKLNSIFNLPATKVAPVEFVMSAVLIHKYKEQCSLPQLAEAIGLMRKNIRKQEKDVRTNSRVMNLMLSYINTIDVSALKTSSTDPGVAAVKAKEVKRVLAAVPSSQKPNGPSPSLATPPPTAPSVESSKRKPSYETSSNGDSVVEVPPPSKRPKIKRPIAKNDPSPYTPPSQSFISKTTNSPLPAPVLTPIKAEPAVPTAAPLASPVYPSPRHSYQPPPMADASSYGHPLHGPIAGSQPSSSRLALPRNLPQRSHEPQFISTFSQPMVTTQIHPDRLATLRAVRGHNLNEGLPTAPAPYYHSPHHQPTHPQSTHPLASAMTEQFHVPSYQAPFQGSQHSYPVGDVHSQPVGSSHQFGSGVNAGIRDNGWGGRGSSRGRGR